MEQVAAWIRHPSGAYLDCLVTNGEHLRHALANGWQVFTPAEPANAATTSVAPAMAAGAAEAGADATDVPSVSTDAARPMLAAPPPTVRKRSTKAGR